MYNVEAYDKTGREILFVSNITEENLSNIVKDSSYKNIIISGDDYSVIIGSKNILGNRTVYCRNNFNKAKELFKLPKNCKWCK